ncbi:restriction endonuclease subunit S [Salegentibacter sediminis]|uniref:restriction endonuclease subunit S n=1 Tax=Salegentibacter sediminis TaxID=1930251 RepID=UPI0009BE1C65|nr:restriction endonuclease subunit S [Salegentibacter sediminis]
MEAEILQKVKIKTVPKLRFKEFTAEWSEKKLGKVFQINAGGDIKKENISPYKNEKFQYPIYANAEKDKGFYGYSNIYTVEAGTITVAGRGVNIGIAHARNHQFYPIVRLLVLKPKNKENIYFFEFAINRINWFVESTGVPQLTAPQLAGYKISLPSNAEQQKIASFLSAVDKKIQQLTRKKALLETYKKGVMQKLFSQEVRFKPALKGVEGEEDGKEYPEWERKRLGEVGKIVSGLTYSPKDIVEDGTLVLRSSNVQNRRLHFNDNVYVNVESYNPVKENDILICVRNGSKRLIGKNAIINKHDEGLAFGAFMTIYRSSFNLFLFHYFDSPIYKKEVHRNLGATINSINGGDLKKFNVPFPSEKEQQKIADFLSALDKKIEAVSHQIEKTQSFKKGLLQQMFV